MIGYGGTFLELARYYDISMVMTPSPDHDRLCLRTEHTLGIVEQCIPPEDRSRHDVEPRLLLLNGIVCQVAGLDNRVAVAFAHELERLTAQLEHQSGCEDRADAIRGVVRIDHRRDRETVPAVLAFPLAVLMRETIHAEEQHLPRLRANIRHCPSLRPELNAILDLTGALPAAFQVLVGDNPQKAADWILTGETPSLKNGY